METVGGPIMSVFGISNWGQIFPKDWFLRLLSLCLAGVLWYFVGGEDIVNKNVMVPVEIINLPRDLVISNQYKKEIEVSVSGPRSLVLGMGGHGVTRQVDLAEAIPGTMVIDNSNDVIKVPRGVQVLGIQPKSVILSLDKMVQRKFAVIPVPVGMLAPDFILKEIRMEPDSISITGPQTVLSQFDVLKTREIDISGLRGPIQLQVPLELDPVIVDLIGATTITADLDIVVETIQKKIPSLTVEVMRNGVLQRVTPATVSITVALPKPLLRQKVDLESLFKVTAIDEQENGQMKVQVTPALRVEYPVSILRVEPPVVTLIEETPAVKPETPVLESETPAKSTDSDKAEVPENP
jgi:hypothetical protein